jgi:starvation-inducible DNA-binding protein
VVGEQVGAAIRTSAFTHLPSGYRALMNSSPQLHFTVPGLETGAASQVIEILQHRLNDCTALHLTLKHVHWNVVGPSFIAVHTMLDPQIDAVRVMADQLAERIATMGGSPDGTTGALDVEGDRYEYPIGRANTQDHLEAVDIVYRDIITSTRSAADELEKLDLVTQDLLVEHLQQLELFHWFVRAHLEDSRGQLATDD